MLVKKDLNIQLPSHTFRPALNYDNHDRMYFLKSSKMKPFEHEHQQEQCLLIQNDIRAGAFNIVLDRLLLQ
jgi:hypothetical protein